MKYNIFISKATFWNVYLMLFSFNTIMILNELLGGNLSSQICE